MTPPNLKTLVRFGYDFYHVLSLELGCNPVVPFSDFHEALAGPADGTRTTAFQKTKFRYGSLRRCFFAPTRPPLLKTINEKD
jgi:hypothetical protein